MVSSSGFVGVASCCGDGGGASPQTWRQLVEILVINFSLDGMTESEYGTLCDDVAPAFAAVPGLVSKVWLADRANGVYGGVYTFEDGAAVDVFLASDLLAHAAATPGLVDLSVRRFEVLSAPTAITRGLAPTAA
jgi:hypothetical protein